MAEPLHPDLERRIQLMEGGGEQGSGFTAIDVVWLALTGVIGPVLLLIWAWPS